MLSKKLMVVLGAIVVLSLALSACATPTPQTIIQTVEKEVVKTVEVEVTKEVIKEVTKEVMVTPEPEPVGPKTLVVCQGQEPDTLYAYGGSMLASSHIQEAVYDGPIDARTYGYQAVTLEKLPSFADGDAVLETVTVQAGDMVVDNDGNAVELAEGVKIRPSGCLAEDCAVEYAGGEVEMDQIVATFKMIAGLTWSDGTP
jgi:ABC-type transport system substrate-binding protein